MNAFGIDLGTTNSCIAILGHSGQPHVFQNFEGLYTTPSVVYFGDGPLDSGEIIVGNKIGRTIGFPTCNTLVDDTMITPPNGVYITTCTIDGITRPSVTNVGVKPTIGTYEKNIETHIFDFNEDVYGKQIRVDFIKHTRGEKKFNGIDELKKQIESDSIEARVWHRQNR